MRGGAFHHHLVHTLQRLSLRRASSSLVTAASSVPSDFLSMANKKSPPSLFELLSLINRSHDLDSAEQLT